MINEKSKRIFIVDDDPYWSELLKGILHSLGYFNVLSFESGEACMDQLGFEPEIIFLDYQMKNTDGITVLKQLREKNPYLYVIFTTSMEELDIAVKAMKLGSFDFFPKSTVSEISVKNILASVNMNRQNSDVFK